MANVFQLMPYLEGDEMVFVQGVVKDMNDNQAQLFANAYSSRRKEPQTVLLTTCLGFVIVAGVQSFLLGHIGMGLLYLFTGGLCLIGTIVDLVNYKKLAFEYNMKVAQEVAIMTRGASQ
jgi:TM2 domain-containing membrane protein YozV